MHRERLLSCQEIPEGRCIKISTSEEVLSSIFLIFILPLSFAFRIDSINEKLLYQMVFLI